MNRSTALILIGTTVLLSPCAWGQQAARHSDPVTVVPEEADELLANPGMGWQTFHHTREQDRNLPDWIPSTVHYARWGWGRLEPRPGEIDYAFLDGVLQETRAAGQQLAFRVMCCSTSPGRPYHPDWLADVGGRILIADYGTQKELAIPDLDDPEVLARHLHFIHRLGARYDGHPDVDHVDLGTVGWWGEWHMSSSTIATMPTVENRRRIIDAYANAFKKTPLLMLIGDPESLAYATERGAGWRADCLGDMGGFSKTWCHMCDAYPQLVRKADVADTWRTAPVAWESCWDMRRWVSEGWPLRYIFNYALAMHGSHLNNKSAPLPEGDDVRQEIERFLRRLGYRFVLRELQHSRNARPGDSLTLAMKWQNVGSAPCYRPYRLAYRLTDERGGSQILIGDATVEQWMPGTVDVLSEEFLKDPPDLPPGEIVEVVDRTTLPASLPTGRYTLGIAIVGEHSADPIVRLAVKGRSPDGWYPLSEIIVHE
ncbi:DUF4832 domain-containing protein [Anaerobaca lacustris]|uniref:DUF4832 domain-containing protein n=1 Tax=Anaerobaca lacustris TaxID=3044600 RepID=A0AAW6TWI9_9BACT|nr:DUF4832 domain-containing protein [Sedimentisphaerales bacterium M17dextr]